MWSIVSIFLLSTSLVNATAGVDEYHAAALISWLQESGGFFHPNLEMRRADPSNPNSRFGMFAKGPIDFKESMLEIPTSMILDSSGEDPEYDTAMVCGTIRNLIKQLKLKDDSKYAPYVNYLLDTQPPGQIPSSWSDAGQKLLHKILEGDGEEKSDYISLPPDSPTQWKSEWNKGCNGADDPLELYAAFTLIQRSWDEILIPVFDLMSHRNGDWTNIESNTLHEGQPASVYASRDIEEGEEIYTTYNHCEDCGARYEDYGTPEILREYGFVEQFPQSWIFHDIEVGFRINQVYDEDREEIEGEYVITEWIYYGGEKPDEDEIAQLQARHDQVILVSGELLSERDENVPEHEWNTIVQYFEALELALDIAIEDAVSDHEVKDDADGNEEVEDDGDQGNAEL